MSLGIRHMGSHDEQNPADNFCFFHFNYLPACKDPDTGSQAADRIIGHCQIWILTIHLSDTCHLKYHLNTNQYLI